MPDRVKGKDSSARQDGHGKPKPKHTGKRKGERDTRSPRRTSFQHQTNDWAAANRMGANRKIIRFNVGGQVFSTSMQTLLNDPNCLLCLMVRHAGGETVSDDENDAGYDGGHGDEDDEGGGGNTSPRPASRPAGHHGRKPSARRSACARGRTMDHEHLVRVPDQGQTWEQNPVDLQEARRRADRQLIAVLSLPDLGAWEETCSMAGRHAYAAGAAARARGNAAACMASCDRRIARCV